MNNCGWLCVGLQTCWSIAYRIAFSGVISSPSYVNKPVLKGLVSARHSGDKTGKSSFLYQSKTASLSHGYVSQPREAGLWRIVTFLQALKKKAWEDTFWTGTQWTLAQVMPYRKGSLQCRLIRIAILCKNKNHYFSSCFKTKLWY